MLELPKRRINCNYICLSYTKYLGRRRFEAKKGFLGHITPFCEILCVLEGNELPYDGYCSFCGVLCPTGGSSPMIQVLIHEPSLVAMIGS